MLDIKYANNYELITKNTKVTSVEVLVSKYQRVQKLRTVKQEQ